MDATGLRPGALGPQAGGRAGEEPAGRAARQERGHGARAWRVLQVLFSEKIQTQLLSDFGCTHLAAQSSPYHCIKAGSRYSLVHVRVLMNASGSFHCLSECSDQTPPLSAFQVPLGAIAPWGKRSELQSWGRGDQG